MNASKILARVCVAATLLMSRAIAQDAPPIPKPTAEHKILAADGGTWDATIKTFAGGPDAEPSVSSGTEINEVMLGDLWVLSKFDGSFGGKFQGRNQFGYDATKSKYVGSWIDSWSPNLTVLEGSYDAKSKTMTYVGEGVDASNKVKYTQKRVTVTKDDDTRVFTLYMKYEGGEEAKFMEIAYKKRK